VNQPLQHNLRIRHVPTVYTRNTVFPVEKCGQRVEAVLIVGLRHVFDLDEGDSVVVAVVVDVLQLVHHLHILRDLGVKEHSSNVWKPLNQTVKNVSIHLLNITLGQALHSEFGKLSLISKITVKDAWDVSVEVYEQWQSVEAVLLLNAGHVDGHHLHVLLVQRLVQLVHCIQYGLVHPVILPEHEDDKVALLLKQRLQHCTVHRLNFARNLKGLTVNNPIKYFKLIHQVSSVADKVSIPKESK